ncbi:MAG: hypothetical protein AABY64_00350 [Bdellovibrionota bacterium]
MLSWLFGKKIEDILDQTKVIKVKGVKFTIKKINVLDHLNGSKVMTQFYDTYKSGNSVKPDDVSEKKIREHFSQVLISGIVKPKISLKEGGEGVFVEKLFYDWDLVNEIYSEIMTLTYGKKKINQLLLAKQN